jgi:type 2A phosphatase activator TIP41
MTNVPQAGLPPAAAPAQAPMPSASGPPYSLKQGKTGSEMRVGSWTIKSAKRPILNGKEIDA